MLQLSKIVRNGCDWAWHARPSILCRVQDRQQCATDRRHAIHCKSADATRRKAVTLATTKAGVAAFATSGDVDWASTTSSDDA
jgi:hypothetical protein